MVSSEGGLVGYGRIIRDVVDIRLGRREEGEGRALLHRCVVRHLRAGFGTPSVSPLSALLNGPTPQDSKRASLPHREALLSSFSALPLTLVVARSFSGQTPFLLLRTSSQS